MYWNYIFIKLISSWWQKICLKFFLSNILKCCQSLLIFRNNSLNISWRKYKNRNFIWMTCLPSNMTNHLALICPVKRLHSLALQTHKFIFDAFVIYVQGRLSSWLRFDWWFLWCRWLRQIPFAPIFRYANSRMGSLDIHRRLRSVSNIIN